MKDKTTKKTAILWGSTFCFPNIPRVGFIRFLGANRKVLERIWYGLGASKQFDPKKCTKVKVIKL